jgi:hypothetical protein
MARPVMAQLLMAQLLMARPVMAQLPRLIFALPYFAIAR